VEPEGEADLASPLTIREREVLGLLARGMGQKGIAKRLVISPKTVSTHIQRVLTKLGVHSRAEAVGEAYRRGLVAADHVDELHEALPPEPDGAAHTLTT
jgi:DNA-binding NarL/FixJ family response regulator